MNRREFLRAASAACAFAGPYQRLASALANKVKITGVKCMIVRGTWDWNLIKVETDAGTQTRTLRFGPAPGQAGEPSWQGYSQAVWQVNGRPLIDTGGTGFVPINRVQGASRGGQLKVTTTNMKSGYLRKNGVPYSDRAVLTEYYTLLPGQQNDSYIALTAMVDDPTYLTGQFIRTYNFKKLADNTGWDPTPCWPR